MKLLIIGLGSIGMRHLRNALELGCECVVVDPVKSRRSFALMLIEEYRGSGTALLPEDLAQWSPWSARMADAVLICTPWDQHLEYATLAIASRIPMFVEKPLGPVEQLPAWRRLVEKSEQDGTVTQVGYMLRFHKVAKVLSAWKWYGGTLRVACNMANWPGDRYGPLDLEASHEIDLALHLGAVPDVSSYVTTDHGVEIVLGGTWTVKIEGDAETTRRSWLCHVGSLQMSATFTGSTALGGVMYKDELAHFVERAQSGEPTSCPLRAGLQVLEVLRQVP